MYNFGDFVESAVVVVISAETVVVVVVLFVGFVCDAVFLFVDFVIDFGFVFSHRNRRHPTRETLHVHTSPIWAHY